jgi:hypothetical protein
VSELDNPDGDARPRRRFWATMPRGTFARVFILLALLATVVVLRRKAGAIAGCMNQAFMLPPPRAAGTAPDGGDGSARGSIRVRLQEPEAAKR